MKPLTRALPALLAGLIATPALAADPQVVAVFDIELSGLRLKKADAAGLDEYLRNKIAQQPGLSVVPPSELKRRLNAEKAESYRACYDEACQIEIGKEVAAQTSVSTKILKLGGQCTVSVVFYDLALAASAGAADATGPCTVGGLARSIESAVLRLARGGPAPQAKRQGVVDPERCPLPDTRRMGEPPPAGRSYRCLDADNRLHGPQVHFHANGRMSARTHHRHGLTEGAGETWHATGKLQEAGQYRGGKKVGVWQKFLSSGVKVQEGPYVDGVRSGVWTYFHGTQGHRIRTMTFTKDLRHGPVKHYRRSGEVGAEGPYLDDVQAGTWKYYRDGKLTSTQGYAAGTRHGLERRFDDKGQVTLEQQWAKGDKHGTYKSWSTTREGVRYLATTSSYTQGDQHGVRKTFGPEGRLRSSTTYAADKRHGPFVRYRSGSEHLERKGSYRNDKLHGPVEEYDYKGVLVRTRHYEDGKQLRVERAPKPKKKAAAEPRAAPEGGRAAPKKALTVKLIGAHGGGLGTDLAEALGAGDISGVGGVGGLGMSGPRFTVSTKVVKGPIDGDVVQSRLERHRKHLRACAKSAGGRVSGELSIRADGRYRRWKTSAVAAPKGNKAAGRCMRRWLQRLRFPQAARGSRVALTLTTRDQ